MLAEKERDFQPHLVNLETLVPEDNFYRQLEAKLDLSFVRDLVRPFYKPFGRPSIDPVVFFKVQLIMFFEDIRSERQLMDMVAMRLDHRWYIGYDLHEKVPDHSSLSKIRDRYGLEVFQRFFERIVDLCIEVGLVWGQELYFDGTIAEANADFDQRIPRFYWQAHAHTQALFDQEKEPEVQDRHFVHKYDGHERVVKASSYRRQVDYWVSPTDPTATAMGKFKLGYRTHYAVDGGKARIILACLVTPSVIQDNTPMLDLTWRTQFRWALPLQVVVGDTKYGTIDNIVALEDGGLQAFTPPTAKGDSRRTKLFPRKMFEYDEQLDRYICPQGESLHYTNTRMDLRFYRTQRNVCKNCPLRPQCTTSKRGRAISHSIYKPYLERVLAYQQTQVYKKAMRKRQVWVEPKFAEVKQWHQGRRFRLRGILKVNIEGLLKAAGQNIKQLLKRKISSNTPKPPAYEAALRLISRLFRLFVSVSV